ncbi:hypothetical protein F5888DRAFT_1631689 [Russula emetica]|nr:hypothetical protein F5888DRAFT_1631689 [Russula emetica]
MSYDYCQHWNLSYSFSMPSRVPGAFGSWIVMFVPELKVQHLRKYTCGCNRQVSQSMAWRHMKNQSSLSMQPESPSPLKQWCTAHFQAGQESLITPDKQNQSRTDNISTTHSCVDASDHPQLHSPSFDEFSPSLPSLDPPLVSNLLQPPGDALTEASDLFVNNVLLNLHTWTHRTTDQSDDEDSEGALEGDAVEAADYVDHETDDFWNGEDIAVEGDVDPCKGIVPDWDLLAEKFIVEAEKLGEFSISDYDLDILRPFGMKIRNNLTASTFHEMSYNFSKVGMENLAKM